MSGKQKKTLYRIITAGVIYILLLVLHFAGALEKLPYKAIECLLFLVPYIIVGYDVIARAVKNISHGEVFDENFLMLIATVAAFAIGEYTEAVAVMLLYQVGELFQSYAVGKSRKSISDMMDIVPEYANIEEDGELVQVDPDDVEIDSVIVIKPGERVPLDGVVTEGESMLDTAALTGESVPRRVAPGDSIVSGCINGSGILKVRVIRAFEDSTVTRILELVENAASKKAKTENFITRFAKYYTPVVTILALLLAVIPPLAAGGDWGDWIKRACIFLVISCPCALVISVPLGFFGGIGAASRAGVLVKGSNYLEEMAKLGTVVFDKTGTLTNGVFKVTEIVPKSMRSDELLELAALCEAYSNHPIALSIQEAYGRSPQTDRVRNAEELSGKGVAADIDGQLIFAGNGRLMADSGVAFDQVSSGGTVVHVARKDEYLGYIVISDTVKDGVMEAVSAVRAAGAKCVMLTGDRKEAAESVSEKLGLDGYHAELLPGDKVAEVEKLLRDDGTLAFVGDGINDAPVLARADVGIAMGSMGSDAAIEAADIVIMDDDLNKIPVTVNIARKTVKIVRENIVFALGVKFAVMLLGALGHADLWLAVFADVGVSVIAILNSLRMLKTR
ncbi:MAG: cadmium-translocating P-type ATPase [Oscillospiraceae bacterium]|nr:cadmium-translocating P-type ATPase [Oscillospiraceae bacterium]